MPSLSSSASTEPLPTTSPLNSATIGTVDLAATASNKTGLQRGASGFAGTSMTTAQDLGRLVAGDDPKATDKAVAASFPPSVTRSLRTDSRTLFGPGGADVQTSYILASPISAADRAMAISVLDAASAPPRPEEVLKLLYRLKTLTASREQHVEDMRAQAACYAEELMRYPADVVRYVLRTQPQHSKFWPTWSELAERLELHGQRRAKMLRALKS